MAESNQNTIESCPMIQNKGDICPHMLEGVLSFVGKTWTLMIIGTLGNFKRLRYSKLLEKLGDISSKTLASRLQRLHDLNLIHRKQYAEVPPRVEYSLSKEGKTLYKLLLPLFTWAVKLDHSKSIGDK